MNRSADPSSSHVAFPSEPRPPRSGEGSFGGRLKALSTADVLEFLRVLGRRGVLVLRDGTRKVSLRVRDGKVLSASAGDEVGSLARFLQSEGRITPDQRETLEERERGGEKINRLLIEHAILNPKDLWETRRRQTRTIVLDLFEWEHGEFQFREGEDRSGGGMEVDLPILELIADGIRGVQTSRLFEERMPSAESVFEAIPSAGHKISLSLEPHERYVLGLIDGSRTLDDVVAASEIGRAETLRVVFLLFSVGYLKMRAFQARPVSAEKRDAEFLPIIRRYNEMFAYLHRYLAREVGPIGDAVLGRYFEEQKKIQQVLLTEERLGRDGTLDERTLVRNLDHLGNGKPKERLIDSLNELLYAELLAVRRTLGSGHEGRAVQGLRELGLRPVTRVEPALRPGGKE